MSEEIERELQVKEEANVEVNAQEDSVVSSKQVATASLSTENIIVDNFVKFFDPLIKHLDTNVQSLRISQYDLTNQIKNLLHRK